MFQICNKTVTGIILALSISFTLIPNTVFAEDASLENRISILSSLPKSHNQAQDIDTIIFFGDSRVEGMGMTCSGNVYIGEVAAGYDWMVGPGNAELQSEMSRNPDAAIVFCFGVNDMGNADRYINYYNSFIEQHKDRSILIDSVNPINDGAAAANGYYTNNSMVVSFNDKIRQSLPDNYLDTYSKLVSNGYETSDGIHYGASTYNTIQDMTEEYLGAV